MAYRPPNLVERVQLRLGHTVVRMQGSFAPKLAGEPVVVDGAELDPMLALLCREDALTPAFSSLSPEAARRQYEVSAHLVEASVPRAPRTRFLEFDGPGGPISLRIDWPRLEAAELPALLYFHGGGCNIGSLDSHAALCRRLAFDAGAVVVSVDYRLAPEHPFPAAIDDCVAAFRWLGQSATDLGIDASRIAIGGDSAGAYLAARVAIETRGEAHRPCYQLLFYPLTDWGSRGGSYNLFLDGFLLDGATMDCFREAYLPEGDLCNPRASILYEEDLTDLPPVWLATAGFDPLRDQARAWVEDLRAAGVEVEHRGYESLTHAFVHTTLVPAARGAVDDAGAALRRAFGG